MLNHTDNITADPSPAQPDAPNPSLQEQVDRYLNDVHSGILPGCAMDRLDQGRLSARFFRYRLGSRFQPVINAHRMTEVIGHRASLSITDGDNPAPGSTELYDIALAGRQAAKLEMLELSLHQLNYYSNAPAHYQLFLALNGTGYGHGDSLIYLLLEQLHNFGWSPRRTVLELPGDGRSGRDKLLRTAARFHEAGFSISSELPDSIVSFTHIAGKLRPDIVSIDSRRHSKDTRLHEAIAAAHAAGARALVHHIGDLRVEQRAIEAGADWLRGSAIAPASSHIAPGVLPPFPWFQR